MTLTPETVNLLIESWKVRVLSGEITASPPTLIMALGLDDKAQLDELMDDPAYTSILKRAHTWMAASWYELLQLPAKEVNGPSIMFALKTMGFSDNSKVVKSQQAFHVHLQRGHEEI
jgi:hypothetical protein